MKTRKLEVSISEIFLVEVRSSGEIDTVMEFEIFVYVIHLSGVQVKRDVKNWDFVVWYWESKRILQGEIAPCGEAGVIKFVRFKFLATEGEHAPPGISEFLDNHWRVCSWVKEGKFA